MLLLLLLLLLLLRRACVRADRSVAFRVLILLRWCKICEEDDASVLLTSSLALSLSL